MKAVDRSTSCRVHHGCPLLLALLAIIACIEVEERRKIKQNHVHERDRGRFRRYLNEEGRHRRDRRIPRPALNHPWMSAWSIMFGSGSDQALITVCGVDHAVFRELEQQFTPVFNTHTPHHGDIHRMYIQQLNPRERQGRKRLVSANMCLGLTLAWSRTRGAQWPLSMIFGMTGTPVSVWIRFGMRILVYLFMHDDAARVRLPTVHEIEEYKNSIQRNFPALQNCYAVCDGLKLHLQQSGNHLIQNRFYNGWTHDHYVSNIFVFVPNGTICICALNAPGSIHDSQLADWGGVYPKLKKVYDEMDGIVVMDSAFSKLTYPFIIKSGQELPVHTTAQEITITSQATSCRQAAEWGMRALQGSFPRLKDWFYYEENGERRVMLKFITLLYNYRARKVGLNQILNTYMPELSRDAN